MAVEIKSFPFVFVWFLVDLKSFKNSSDICLCLNVFITDLSVSFGVKKTISLI